MFDCTIPNNTLSRAELNYESGSVRNIHYGDILIKYGSVVDVQNDEIPFATGKSSDDFKGALLRDGDIIIADTAEDETTGKACEIGNSQGLDVVSGLHTMVCRPRNKMALGYLGYYLNSDAYHHQLLPLMQGIKVLSLSRTNVQKTMVCYPKSKAEQQLIADCFRNLDNLITLHQREFVFLCKEKIEIIRYIKNTWEQRKFDEVFDCTIPNNTLSRAELNYESGSVRNIHYGDILIKYGSVVDVQNDEIPFATGKSSDDFKGALLRDGDIIIADTAEDETTGKACEIGNSQGLDVVSGLHTMVCRPRNKMALGYLGYYLNSDAYHHQLLPLMQGIKVLSLSRTNVQKTMVCYPKSKAEQQLIADCFRNLDNLITLHQRKPNFYTGGYYAE